MRKALVSGLVLALVAAMGLGFPACSGDGEIPTTTLTITITTVAETTTTTVAETTTTTVAETTTTTVATTTTTAFPQESIALRYATTFARTEPAGRVIQRFVDYVEEATGGAVSFDVFFDGVLGADVDELALVRSGTVDMATLGFTKFPNQLPLLCLTGWAPGEQRDVIGLYDHLVFEDPSTARLIRAEAEANNLSYMGFIAGGANVFVGREPLTVLSDLVGAQFGAGDSIPAFEALGYTVVETSLPDVYEALSAGLVDATRAGFSVTVDLKWYELAKHYTWDGTHAVGGAFSVNLGTWDKLVPETQEVFREAALDAGVFSKNLDAADVEASIGLLEEAGVTFGTLGAEDQAAWLRLLFEAGASECMTRAVTLGIAHDMMTVLSTAAGLTGTAWTPPAR